MGVIDYTVVISTLISALGAVSSAAIAAWIARQVKTPSGDTLGAVAERTHDLATVSVKTLHNLDGGGGESERDAGADTN